MKIQITPLILFLTLCFACTPFYGQLNFIGSSDYGRIFNITYDPLVENKLYATSLNNHILVSNDNGERWEVLFSMPYQEVTEFQDLKITNNNTALSFIKYNQDSPDNTILILDLATNAIIKELEIPYVSNFKYIQSYSISAENSDFIIMNTVLDFGASEHTYYSIDAGQNWEVIHSKADYDDVSLNNIAINPQNPQHIILTRGFGPNGVEGGMLMSIDSGQTWELKLDGIILNPIAFNPINTDEIYMGTGISFGNTPENLYRSLDAGTTWEIVALPWTEGNLDNINLIAFNANFAGHIIVLEENEIVISKDSGVSWQNYVYDLEDTFSYYSGWNLSFNPFQQNEVYINSDYFPLFSDDAGVTTVWKKNNYFRSTGSIGLYTGTEEHLYYGVQYGYVHRNLTTEVENTFDIMPLNAYSQGGAPILFVDNRLEGRIFTFSNGWFGADLKVSIDHGQIKYPIYNTYLNYVDALETNPFDLNEIWYSLSNNMGDVEFWKANISDLNNITTTALTLPNIGVINGIYFDEITSGKVIISIGTNIYQSEDRGNTWLLSNSGLEELVPNEDLILALASNPLNENQLSIATNQGVYTSNDGGDNWTKIYDALVHKIYHSSADDGTLVGIVLDSEISRFRVIYSQNMGETWEHVIDQEFLDTAVADVAIRFEEELVEFYIGSIDLGLMHYSLEIQDLGTNNFSNVSPVIQIYPNPVKDILYINAQKSIKNISVFSLNGQELLNNKINKTTTNFDISILANGVYLIRIETENDLKTLKFIKQ